MTHIYEIKYDTSNDQFTKNHKANHSQHNLHGGYRLYMTMRLTRD